MGDHHFSLHVLADISTSKTTDVAAERLKLLNDRVALARTLLADTGMTVAREDLALEAAFWAQLPGNFSYRPRKAPITSRNFAAMAAFHNFPAGRASSNHWGDALALLITSARSPYYFSLHASDPRHPDGGSRKDTGHTFVCGPTGSGKTVFLRYGAGANDQHPVGCELARAHSLLKTLLVHASSLQPSLQNIHWNPAVLATSLRRIHELIDFQGLVVGNRQFSRFKELHNSPYQRRIAVVVHISGYGWRLIVVENDCTSCAIRPDGADRSDTAILPDSGHHIGIGGIGARYLLYTGPHDGEEHLDGMNCVPGEIQLLMLFEWPWSPHSGSSEIWRTQCRDRSKAPGGGTEPRNFAGFRDSGDFHCVRECGGKRFIDEYRFSASRGLPELVEVNPTVHALKQNSIDQSTEIANLAHEPDVPFVFEFCAKSFDTIPALGHVRAGALEGGDYASAGHMIRVGSVVQELGEFHHMRSVGADNAQPQVGCECAGSEKNRRQNAAGEGSDPIRCPSGLYHLIRPIVLRCELQSTQPKNEHRSQKGAVD